MDKFEAMHSVAATLDGVTSMGHFVSRVLELWPSRAKRPQDAIRRAIRTEPLRCHVVEWDPPLKTIMPLDAGLRGVQFRIVVDPRAAHAGLLSTTPAWLMFLPYRYHHWIERWAEIVFVNESGRRLPTRVDEICYRARTPLLGEGVQRELGFAMTDWFHQRQIAAGDSVLVTIEDWAEPRLRLMHEPVSEWDESATSARDSELTDRLCAMLRQAPGWSLYPKPAIIQAMLHLSDRCGDPGSPWEDAVQRDDRLFYAGGDIVLGQPDGEAGIFLEELMAALHVEEIGDDSKAGEQSQRDAS